MRDWSLLEKSLLFGLTLLLGGVLGAAGYSGIVLRADRIRARDLHQTASLVELAYFADFAYPTSVRGHVVSAEGELQWGSEWSPYTTQLPLEHDRTHLPYCYEKTSSGFVLTAQLLKPVSSESAVCNGLHYNYAVRNSQP